MKIFAVADLHLSFNENINKPMNKFGPGWEDHPDRLKDNWEKLVTDEDIVLIPGALEPSSPQGLMKLRSYVIPLPRATGRYDRTTASTRISSASARAAFP